MRPTMAITTAPPTPPPPTLERIDDISSPEELAALAIAAAADAPPACDSTILRSCPPIPPPTRPAMEFPIGPKFKFFSMAPAMLPPTAPLISWMIKGSMFSSIQVDSESVDSRELQPGKLQRVHTSIETCKQRLSFAANRLLEKCVQRAGW